MGERSGSAVAVASAWGMTPRRIPRIGQVLDLAGAEVRYRGCGLRLRLDRVRLDISGWYDGAWVWVEGQQLDGSGRPVGWQQALVAVAAIERAGPTRPVGGLRRYGRKRSLTGSCVMRSAGGRC